MERLEEANGTGDATPKANGKKLFSTPTKKRLVNSTPSKTKKADQSAKRKSAKIILEQGDDDEWEQDNALAQEILDEEPADGTVAQTVEDIAAEQPAEGEGLAAETPSKRGRGRPKGAKNKRSPTPEGNIPPEERYFYQNRSGPPQVSNNTLASMKLLTHEEYFNHANKSRDQHESERAYLLRLHARSFPQWHFEFVEGFNICLYGWGSKRKLTTRFAEYIHSKTKPSPTIIIVNGYLPKTTIRTIMSLVAETVMGEHLPKNLPAQPSELIDIIFSHLTAYPRSNSILLLVNSIDASNLRRHSTQSILARLAAHPKFHLLGTTDTATFPLLWDSTLRSQFKFAFHDCTTYASYRTELNVVDDVHELLGRKGHRIGGKEGVEFVLKSLPRNAKELYRLLLTEILTVLDSSMPLSEDEGDEAEDGIGSDGEETGRTNRRNKSGPDGEIGISYRGLYEKASDEYICSSEMSFRTLLKEFYDHQMIVSRTDAAGQEMLGAPLSREDMESLLEELVLSQ